MKTTNTILPQENDANVLDSKKTPGMSRQLGDSLFGEDELVRAGKCL